LKRQTIASVISGLICMLPLAATAQEAATQPAAQPATAPAAARPRELTVALLDFAASAPGATELGPQIGEVLTATLSSEPGFRLVDRATLTRTLQEHELNLSGIVDTEQAVKVGKLVGARILVTGKVFQMGKKLFVTAKLIGTETSLVEGVLVKGDAGADMGELMIEMAVQIGDRLRSAGPKLVASDDQVDPVPALKKKLANLKKPVVAVVITEEHMAQRPVTQAVDPAVETEVKKLLRDCGFEIVDVDQNALADWARGGNKLDGSTWPKGLQNADYVVTGEAFSEFAARIGNLVSCLARAEVNVIRRQDGKVVLADRETTRAVDLAENIAGKKALEKSGRLVAIRVLEHFATRLSGQTDGNK
jgi:curli biogenesis system outer membrane secretion channel CsgG